MGELVLPEPRDYPLPEISTGHSHLFITAPEWRNTEDTSMELPDLAGVATKDLVEQISGNGSFKASYINWSRTVNMLRQHAPGWMPETVPDETGSLLHRAPVGGYLLIRFVHVDGFATPPVPQAVMDNKNAAIAYDRITARDITDTQRRGVCMAAAFTFGLAYELWAKMPLESGFHEEQNTSCKPSEGAWEAAESLGYTRVAIEKVGNTAIEYWDMEDVKGAMEYIASQSLPNEAKIALNTMFPSKFRSAMKKLNEENKASNHE